MLADTQGFVRWQAAEALLKLNDRRAFEPLLAALNDPNGPIRFKVTEILSAFGDARAIQPL